MRRGHRAATTAAMALAVGAPLALAYPAVADPARRPAGTAGTATPVDPSTVDPGRRDAVLGSGWRSSPDLAWTTSGDANGLHVLVATAASGYTWHTATTLVEPGLEADQWIGNACLTGSGTRLVVVYAPRTFTNDTTLSARGGFTAVVDLTSGAVTKLAVTTSLAYFNPGCGAGETAVLTQEGNEDRHQTRLLPLDAATGRVAAPITLPGQVTSAVPMAGGVAAADGDRLVAVRPDGTERTLARTANPAFRLHPDAAGGLVYLDRAGGKVRVQRTAPTATAANTMATNAAVRTATLATGTLGDVGLAAAAGGRVYVTGHVGTAARLDHVQRQAAVARLDRDTTAGALVSSHGGLVLDEVGPAAPRTPTVTIRATAARTGKKVTFGVDPAARTAATLPQGRAVSPATAGSPTNPVDDDRWCAVPRNDVRSMVYQPTPRQVEWAADMAVQDQLHTQRPANFKDFGLPAYAPQDMFPNIPLVGGGHVPVQVLLGILAQESNLWQASGHAMSGEFGNPLVGNFYGREIYDGDPANDWEIHWDQSDCGYGVAQVTDGMRLAGHEKPGETALPATQQRAIALDYAANIAEGLRILETKWNQVAAANMTINDGGPDHLENWFYAVWAYNTGLHPDLGNGSPWGVGWANNPVNPRYPADRHPFLDGNRYSDAAIPQDWPYEEKVLGWAAWPISTPDGPGYRAAWWNSDADRTAVKPPITLFCDQFDDCYPGQTYQNDEGDVPGPCSRPDLTCWEHEPATWRPECPTDCGNELIRFDPGYPEQPDGTHYPPDCTTGGLPSNSVIVDDVPGGTPVYRCGGYSATTGSFSLNFATDGTGDYYPSKINFHQLGGGYDGHFWFGQTIPAPSYGHSPYEVIGTWKPPSAMTGWTRIKVHLPPNGAWTRQADYKINLGNGTTRHRVVNQAVQANTWVDLGIFKTSGTPSVTLSNITLDGRGDDIAYDAVAFIPASKPTAAYVALGDSYAAGEGVAPYAKDADLYNDGEKDACHRSPQAYAHQVKLPGHGSTIEQEAQSASGSSEFVFLACSGAIMPSITNDAVDNPPTADDTGHHVDWGTGDQHWGEVPQVDSGYLDENTTLVTLSVGGNDARFSDILGGCVVTVPITNACSAPGYVLTRKNKSVDPADLQTYETHLFDDPDKMRAHLEKVYLAVHAKAPNARIVVLGYPQLFPDNPTSGCQGPTDMLLGPNDEKFINAFVPHFTAALTDAVSYAAGQGVNITFIDPTPTWRNGGHWACGATGTQYTNGITGPSYSGSTTPGSCPIPGVGDDNGGCELPGAGAFHPTAAGQQAFAALVNARLAGTG